MLESSGVNLDSGARAEAFAALLDEYSASYDDESMELHSEYVEESALPDMAMRFIALLLRVQDLELLNPQTVENTFRQDAQRALSKYFDSKATIEFDTSPAGSPDYVADAVIRADQRDPVALYFGTRDARVDEAVMLWMDTRLTGKPCRVALLLESEKTPIAGRSKRRAMNRLDATTVFRGDEQAAMSRIGQLVGVPGEAWH
jgi:hypothetical protein